MPSRSPGKRTAVRARRASSESVPPADAKRYRRTREIWTREFLATLAATSNVTAAAAETGLTLGHIYKLRREDPEFARKWQGALCEGYDNLEFELLARLRSGNTGDEAGRKFDNAAALRLLTAHRESVSRERALRDNEDAARIVESINAKLDQMRQRAIAAGEDVWAVAGDDE